MGYCQFLNNLFNDGRLTVPEVSPLTDDEIVAGDEVLVEHERLYRLEMADTAPKYVASAGRWASLRFFRACQFTVFRDFGEEALKNELEGPPCAPDSPDVHYSVDLIFRFLPDLIKIAGSAAQRDPLLNYLHRWAQEWPLSSVGVTDVEDVRIDCFVNNSSLMLLYADRIIATGDGSRLSEIAVRHVVRGALGMFSDLSPKIQTALSEYDNEDRNE